MKLKNYIHVLVMLGVFIAVFTAYEVWHMQVAKQSADAQMLAEQIQLRTQSAAQAVEARNELEEALADEASIRAYFVNTGDVVSFLESLQRTGSALGAKVEVSSVAAEPAKPHAVLILSLRISGSFDSVVRTLGAIEFQPYDTVVSNLSLDTGGTGERGAAALWTAATTVRVGTNEVSGATATTTRP